MRWSKPGKWAVHSDTMPAYTVGSFIVDGAARYRASFNGEQIGQIVESAREAKRICEQHNLITKEAKDING